MRNLALQSNRMQRTDHSQAKTTKRIKFQAVHFFLSFLCVSTSISASHFILFAFFTVCHTIFFLFCIPGCRARAHISLSLSNFVGLCQIPLPLMDSTNVKREMYVLLLDVMNAFFPFICLPVISFGVVLGNCTILCITI